MIRRRDFLALTAVGAAALPTIAVGQRAQSKRVGFLTNLAEDDPASPPRVEAFWAGIRPHGWTETNLEVEFRWGASSNDVAAKPAAELVALKPDLLFATTTPPITAFAKLTQTIPIVFAYVSGTSIAGLVQSYAHPGGNITGFVNWPDDALYGKRIELIKDLTPGTTKVALIYNPDAVAGGESTYLSSNAALAAQQNVQIVPYPVKSPADISAAVKSVADAAAMDPGLGLFAGGDSYLSDNRALAIAEVAKYGLVAVWGQQSFTTSGGLISYAPDPIPIYRGGGDYAGLVLNGANPADLPIQTSPAELTVNLKTAKAMGITIPASVLAVADQVIE